MPFFCRSARPTRRPAIERARLRRSRGSTTNRPTSDLVSSAAAELARLEDVLPSKRSAARVALELGRAERLFSAKRYQAARQAFEALDPLVAGDDAERVTIRLAECDHFLRRYRQARERLSPLLATAARKEEARFYFLSATRGLGAHDEYVSLARALVEQFPGSPWAEETLNNLATHYIVSDEDEQADAVFRELYAKFPKGAYAERAAWRAGWWAYRHGRPSGHDRASSRARRRPSRAPTTGPRISTGRRGRASGPATGRVPPRSTASPPPTT